MANSSFVFGWTLTLWSCLLLSVAIARGVGITWGFTFAGVTVGLIGLGFLASLVKKPEDNPAEVEQ